MTERQANRQQKSIVVLVSGNGSNLQAIIDDIFQLKINAKISAPAWDCGKPLIRDRHAKEKLL